MDKIYYFVSIALGLLAILPVHFYLKSKLKEDADNSLIWFAAALGIWLMLEWVGLKTEKPQNIVGIRRILSVLNSACFILFLSYFKEGWGWLNEHIKSVTATPERLVLVLSTLVLLTTVLFFEEKTPWLWAETAMSILVSLLLTLGFVRSFARRAEMRFMIPLALIGGVLLVWTQVVNLADEGGLGLTRLPWYHKDELIYLRMLQFFCLILNTFALALSALGASFSEKKETENTQPTPPSTETKSDKKTEPETETDTSFLENLEPSKAIQLARPSPEEVPLVDAIRISGKTRHIEVFLYLNTKTGKRIGIRYDHKDLTKSKRAFLLKHIQSPTVHYSDFNNYAKEKKEFLEKINKKTQPLGITVILDDLIADGNKAGNYRLTLPPEKIDIDPEAQKIIGIKK